MSILITGGAGFVGANLAFYLKHYGFDVTVIDNLARRGSEFNLREFKRRNIKFVHGDIRCPEDLANIKNIDVICECSAQPSAIDGYDNPLYDITNNTVGLINVLEYARKNECQVIFWSTNKVYSGDNINEKLMTEGPTRYEWVEHQPPCRGFDASYGYSNKFTIDGGQHSIYGMSKVMSDLACQEYFDAFGVKTVVNRFSCLAGQRQWGKSAQGWVAWWAIAAEFDLPVKYIGWKGKQVRDVLFIDDICNLIYTQIKNIDKVAGQVYNIGGGMNNTLSLIEATALMERLFDKKMTVSEVVEPRKADHCIYISDIRKIKEDIGWEPKVDIITGYTKIIEWIKENRELLRTLYG